MKKYLLLLVLVFALALSVCATITMAESPEEFVSGFYTYTLSGNEATIVKASSDFSGTVNIPSTLSGYKVVGIGRNAFSGNKNITKVVIPSTVTTIDAFAFENCSGLTSLTIGSNITAIGSSAFLGCSGLKNVSIPNSVTQMGTLVFKGCTGLTSATIGTGMTEIREGFFSGCTSLTTVTMGENITAVSKDAFKNCTALTTINWGSNVQTIGEKAFYGCTALKSVSIPNSVTTIAMSAFSDCSGMTYLTLGDHITSVSSYVFKNCTALKEVIIPQSVTLIDSSSFNNCKSITTVYLPVSIEKIGIGAFSSCGSITDVYYEGTRSNWGKVNIRSLNDPLKNATIHYEHYVHEYDKVITYPTATKHGYTTYTCKLCKDSYVNDYIFPDVRSNAWYYNAVEFAVRKGYFSGYKNGNFGPGDSITRQDFVVVLARIEGVDLSMYSGRTVFKDVPAGSYYEAAVKWASSKKIISGYSNGKFGVGDKLTREQLVTILYNYAKLKGCNVSVNEAARAKLMAFSDGYKVTGYAQTACAWALQKGVLGGLNATTFAPQNYANRAQVAQILMNICNNKVIPF